MSAMSLFSCRIGASVSGQPLVVESPSAATTMRSASGIGLARDLGRLPFALPDDVVALSLVDDRVDIGDLVAGKHREVRRVTAKGLVFRARHRDLLGARR